MPQRKHKKWHRKLSVRKFLAVAEISLYTDHCDVSSQISPQDVVIELTIMITYMQILFSRYLLSIGGPCKLGGCILASGVNISRHCKKMRPTSRRSAQDLSAVLW